MARNKDALAGALEVYVPEDSAKLIASAIPDAVLAVLTADKGDSLQLFESSLPYNEEENRTGRNMAILAGTFGKPGEEDRHCFMLDVTAPGFVTRAMFNALNGEPFYRVRTIVGDTYGLDKLSDLLGY